MKVIKALSAVIYAPLYFLWSLLGSFADWGEICFENDCWPWQVKPNTNLEVDPVEYEEEDA